MRNLWIHGCKDASEEVSNTVIQGLHSKHYLHPGLRAVNDEITKKLYNDEASDEKEQPLLTLLYFTHIYSSIYYLILSPLLNTLLLEGMPRVSQDDDVLGSSSSTIVV